jgi:hypothetical protein
MNCVAAFSCSDSDAGVTRLGWVAISQIVALAGLVPRVDGGNEWSLLVVLVDVAGG